jgi:hypothetical protein
VRNSTPPGSGRKGSFKEKEDALDEFTSEHVQALSRLGMYWSGEFAGPLSGISITVNYDYDDETLRAWFEGFLRYRSRLSRSTIENPKPFGETDFRKWHEYQILAVFDLDLWGQLNRCKFTDSLIAKTLWPDTDSADSEKGIFEPAPRLRRTIRPMVAEVINWRTFERLKHQVRGEG